MEVVARIGIYGDIHLSSKNYGAHYNYPAESLEYYEKIAEIAEKKQLTHLIGAGDFTYGRFNTLEYRSAVDNILNRMYKATNGRHYMLQGNHDVAGYGLCERDYYINKGLLRPSENLKINNLNITMVDYGKHETTEANIEDDVNKLNFVIAHDFFKFNNTNIANFGKAYELDNFDKWFGADYLICGHVHKIMSFDGNIIKDGMAHELKVHYLGCMTRPSYREGYMDENGQVLILTLYDDGHLEYDIEIVKLWSLSKAFNFVEIEKNAEKKEEKASRVDISDIVKQLDSHDRNVGNPEDIIKDLKDIPDSYKNKAIQLLKDALG